MTARHTNSISAIVCNYNYGDFIHETLDSLARQTHRPNKLIIVDDGSDDFSRNVIDEFLAARGDLFDHCHFIRNEANVGKLACLNTALALVDTTYSIILDSDNFLPEHAIESLLANLLIARQTAPETGFVYSDSYLVNQEGDVICRGRSAEWSLELLSTHSYIPERADPERSSERSRSVRRIHSGWHQASQVDADRAVGLDRTVCRRAAVFLSHARHQHVRYRTLRVSRGRPKRPQGPPAFGLLARREE